MTDIEADFAALRQVSDRWTFGDDEEVFVAALSRIETALKEAQAERDAEINRRALAEETIEAQHMCLDDMGAPRKDGVGVLSLHGRTLRVIAAMRADLECRTLERDASEAQMNAVCDKLGVADDFDADDAPGQIGRLQETIAALTAAEPFITAELRAMNDLAHLLIAEQEETLKALHAKLARIEAAARLVLTAPSFADIDPNDRDPDDIVAERVLRAAIEEGTPT